jgi:hopanoid biosynthesis associated protein HpnK
MSVRTVEAKMRATISPTAPESLKQYPEKPYKERQYPESRTALAVIASADDFGDSPEVNRAVARAYREGVLTSTSLMVTGAAFEEAVGLARTLPKLAVGLHLVLIAGRPASPPERIPHLLDGNGRFPDDPVRAGLNWFFNPVARRELGLEIEAQFTRFTATGLKLSHVDSHLHMHLHPTVFNLLLPCAERYGARGLRVPGEPLLPALAWEWRGALHKALWAAAFGPLGWWQRRKLRDRPFVTAHTYGLMQSGAMGETYVADLLMRLAGPVAELYFHPTTGAEEPLGASRADLAALLSPQVRQAAEARGVHWTTYPALADEVL